MTLTTSDVEALVGDSLPENARYPSWWRNDRKKMHSRAWLTAGWEVVEMDPATGAVVFLRAESARVTRGALPASLE